MYCHLDVSFLRHTPNKSPDHTFRVFSNYLESSYFESSYFLKFVKTPPRMHKPFSC